MSQPQQPAVTQAHAKKSTTKKKKKKKGKNDPDASLEIQQHSTIFKDGDENVKTIKY